MKLTFKQLLIATIVFVLIDLVSFWIEINYAPVNWFSPLTLKFWAKDLALVIGWIWFLVQKRKK